MNNNEINFLDRDCENVTGGNEKKIQFYSKTYSSICEKYRNWRYNSLIKQKTEKEEKIKDFAKIADMKSIGTRNQQLIKRKMAQLQDQVEYLNLALDDEQYLHVSVRLLKVAERARNSIVRWWADFIKYIPIVGKKKEEANTNNQNSETRNDGINVDDIISPESVIRMIDDEFTSNETVSNRNTASKDELIPVQTSSTELRAIPAENSAAVVASRDEFVPVPSSMELPAIPSDVNDDFSNTSYPFDQDSFTNMSSGIGSVNKDEESNVESYIDAIMNGNSSMVNDQDTIKSLQEYKEILKRQNDKKRELDLQKQRALEEYQKAQAKNNEVRDQNSYLREVISSRLDAMENDLNMESQRTQEQLTLMRDKTNELNSNTNKLDHSNESLKAMCDELNIGVQTKESFKGKYR